MDYINHQADKFNWEIIVVNDGSTDNTGALAEIFSKSNKKIKVYHHRKNRGLGKGLQTAFDHSLGDIVITLDIDLSTHPEYILKMIEKLNETDAEVVIASPMLKGGLMSGMPWYRYILSICANKFLSYFAPGNISSLTSMSRAYKGEFIRGLSLHSSGMEIMPEILYKTLIMNGKIEEIPGCLIWNTAENSKAKRISKMPIFKHTIATLFSGFLLKPFLFFIFPGLLLSCFSLYSVSWMFIHFFNEYAHVTGTSFLDRATNALEIAYRLHPHTFLISLFSILLSIQLIAIGFLSLQNKHYFEEMFYVITRSNYKKNKKV